MTVAELRKILDNYDDDALIMIDEDSSSAVVVSHITVLTNVASGSMKRCPALIAEQEDDGWDLEEDEDE